MKTVKRSRKASKKIRDAEENLLRIQNRIRPFVKKRPVLQKPPEEWTDGRLIGRSRTRSDEGLDEDR